MTIKIGINGLGRIGRMVIRSIIETNNKTKVPILKNFKLINKKLFKNTKITFLKKT